MAKSPNQVVKTEKRQARPTFGLHGNLCERAPAAAEKLCLNTNAFINKCVEGCLAAAETDRIAIDIPIVRLLRRVAGKPALAADRIEQLCLLHAPDGPAPTPPQCRAFLELLEEQAESLTPELMVLFWRLAYARLQRQQRYEAELAELMSSSIPV